MLSHNPLLATPLPAYCVEITDNFEKIYGRMTKAEKKLKKLKAETARNESAAATSTAGPLAVVCGRREPGM